MACAHDPLEMAGKPIGQYHCPECGCMVLAGVPHEVTGHDDECPHLIVEGASDGNSAVT